MTDTTRDDPLEWHVVFDDGQSKIYAADIFDGVLLLIATTRQFLPGYRVLPQQGDMDRARLVRR